MQARLKNPAALVPGAMQAIQGLIGAVHKAGTPVIPTAPTRVLVTEGPFQYTRNPGYLGMAIAYKGLALCFGRIGPLLFLLVAVAVMEWGVIGREERYLERKFGSAYQAYRSAVPRWLWWL